MFDLPSKKKMIFHGKPNNHGKFYHGKPNNKTSNLG